MSLSMTLFTFLNAWWICLFMALPFGWQEGEKSDIAYKAAPGRFNWKKSVLIATVLAVLFTGLLALVIRSGLFHMDSL